MYCILHKLVCIFFVAQQSNLPVWDGHYWSRSGWPHPERRRTRQRASQKQQAQSRQTNVSPTLHLEGNMVWHEPTKKAHKSTLKKKKTERDFGWKSFWKGIFEATTRLKRSERANVDAFLFCRRRQQYFSTIGSLCEKRDITTEEEEDEEENSVSGKGVMMLGLLEKTSVKLSVQVKRDKEPRREQQTVRATSFFFKWHCACVLVFAAAEPTSKQNLEVTACLFVCLFVCSLSPCCVNVSALVAGFKYVSYYFWQPCH